MAAYNGIKDGNSAAKVEVGEFAPSQNINYWVKTVQNLPHDGTNLHPYGTHIDLLQEFKSMIKGPMNISEDGAFANDPNQINTAGKRLKIARCAGAASYYFYNPFNYASNQGWNTGFINKDGDNSAAQKAIAAAMQD